jgi:hypothetical protein
LSSDFTAGQKKGFCFQIYLGEIFGDTGAAFFHSSTSRRKIIGFVSTGATLLVLFWG